jgi:hypothetical protein
MTEDAPKQAADDSPALESYPTQCPVCHEHTAKPKSATTVKGQEFLIRLDMLCGSGKMAR